MSRKHLEIGSNNEKTYEWWCGWSYLIPTSLPSPWSYLFWLVSPNWHLHCPWTECRAHERQSPHVACKVYICICPRAPKLQTANMATYSDWYHEVWVSRYGIRSCTVRSHEDATGTECCGAVTVVKEGLWRCRAYIVMHFPCDLECGGSSLTGSARVQLIWSGCNNCPS